MRCILYHTIKISLCKKSGTFFWVQIWIVTSAPPRITFLTSKTFFKAKFFILIFCLKNLSSTKFFIQFLRFRKFFSASNFLYHFLIYFEIFPDHQIFHTAFPTQKTSPLPNILNQLSDFKSFPEHYIFHSNFLTSKIFLAPNFL